MRHAVIMAGGVGTRLWPVSRQATPKQFQKLIGDRSLLQQTFDRLLQLLPANQIWVMTGEQYRQTVHDQLPDMPAGNIITEPHARNTAAATGLAVLAVVKTDPEAEIAIVASDHYVGKVKVFAKALETAFKFVHNQPGSVTTVGLHPATPNTGYGYIQVGDELAKIGNRTVFKVTAFKEKPDIETAKQYIESGQYLWNASYFIFNGAKMIDQFWAHAPELTKILENYLKTKQANDYALIDKAKNFDQVIIEKLTDLAVIPAEMEWSDIGDWAALHDVLTNGNKPVLATEKNIINNQTVNTLVMGGNKLIATVGLKDIVVIDTDDVILVCHKDSAQDVKKIVEQLQAEGRGEYL